MNREQRRTQAKQGNRHIKKVNREQGYGPELREVAASEIAHAIRPPGMLRVWRSDRFMVQEYDPPKNSTDVVLVRLSVNLTAINPSRGRWEDGIAWDELQALKAQCGYGKHDAVEVFPHEDDADTAHDSRHLWILTGPLPFIWRHTA